MKHRSSHLPSHSEATRAGMSEAMPREACGRGSRPARDIFTTRILPPPHYTPYLIIMRARGRRQSVSHGISCTAVREMPRRRFVRRCLQAGGERHAGNNKPHTI